MIERWPRAAIGILALVMVLTWSVAPDFAFAQASAMSFRLAQLDARACGARCPRVIVAEGVIEEDTPENFIAFLQSMSGAANVRDVVVIDSPGGRVVASMRLGAALRKLRAAVIVARFSGGDDLALPTAGQCMSACVYAMMGGVRRIVPPQSRLGIHRMSSQEGGGIPGRLSSAPATSYASADMVSALATYAAQMGVSPTVIRLAERIPPQEIHIVSPGELRRWRLASPRF
ncbi:MAG: hypothetical protein ABSG83_17065 [Roseiarcus sp.]|jgi:hypothetical protein